MKETLDEQSRISLEHYRMERADEATHAGVKAMFGLHFVSKGIVPIEHGKTFNTLFEKRHSSDYEAFAYCDKTLVDDLTPLAEAFISQIKELIKNNNV